MTWKWFAQQRVSTLIVMSFTCLVIVEALRVEPAYGEEAPRREDLQIAAAPLPVERVRPHRPPPLRRSRALLHQDGSQLKYSRLKHLNLG